MKKIFLTLSILIISVTLSFAENFHLITITQRDASGESVGAPKDEETIKLYAKELAETINANLKVHSFGHLEFRSSTVEQLGIRPEDIVWFHYSGHSQTYNGFPMAGRVKQTEIYDLLRAKAKFTLSTWDGCNINQPIADLRFATARLPSATQNIRRLFQASQGSVIAAASQTGEASWGSKELGGIFTNSFIQAIRMVTYESSAATWEEVKAKAEQLTQETARSARRTQSPKIILHIGRQVENPATHNAPETAHILHIVKVGETYESIANYYRKYEKYASLTAALLRKYNSSVPFKEGAELYLIQ